MGKTKKTLVIHPDDRTTDFLCHIYEDIRNKTVIRMGVSQKDIRKLIKSHDRIIMLGHGCQLGLFSLGMFPGSSGCVIDINMVNVLKEKSDCYYIWCNADKFVDYWELKGFYSGMFISEVGEAYWFNIVTNQDVVNESNYTFSEILSKYIKRPIKQTHKKVIQQYGELVQSNPVVSYNHQRLYLRV